MYSRKDKFSQEGYLEKFTVIDLDPYGTCIPFLDSAIQSVSEGGFLCVTSTDMRNLQGPEMARAFYLYGVSRAKVLCHQESAIRLILYSINSIANKYGRYIIPKFSYLSEYYLRVFFQVKSSKR